MDNVNWTHLILAILIMIFIVVGTKWLVIILAALIAILSVFGVCSCSKSDYYKKKEIKPAPRKRKKKR